MGPQASLHDRSETTPRFMNARSSWSSKWKSNCVKWLRMVFWHQSNVSNGPFLWELLRKITDLYRLPFYRQRINRFWHIPSYYTNSSTRERSRLIRSIRSIFSKLHLRQAYSAQDRRGYGNAANLNAPIGLMKMIRYGIKVAPGIFQRVVHGSSTHGWSRVSPAWCGCKQQRLRPVSGKSLFTHTANDLRQK